MKIVDQTVVEKSAVMTMNDIPVGTIFRGSVWGVNSCEWTSGVFYKADGPVGSLNGGKRVDFIIVRVDKAGGDRRPSGYWANGWLHCAAVKDYQPLDVELVIKGVL